MQKNENRKSLEAIERGIWKRIQEAWKLKEQALENFDPIVKLLVGACAYELKNISDELYNSQDRVLERLAGLMAPDIYTKAIPASTVLHLQPQDAEVIVLPEFQIAAKKETKQNNAIVNKEVVLSPAGAFKLYHASIQKMLYAKNNELFDAINNKNVGRAENSKIAHNKIWIGIEFHDKIRSLDEIVFFVHWKDATRSELEINMSHLRNASCSLSQQDLMPEYGIRNFEKQTEDVSNLGGYLDISKFIDERTRQKYFKSFLTFRKCSGSISLNREILPWGLDNLLLDGQFKDELTWLEIELQNNLKASDIVGGLVIELNCFPALNRQMHNVKFKLSDQLNIFPLETQDDFLAIKGVVDTEGHVFEQLLNLEHVSSNTGTYCLRHGHVQRFDSRQSRDLIDQLIRSLKDEWASYEALGRDEIRDDLNDIRQALARIQDRVGVRQGASKEHWFLMLNTDLNNNPGWNHVNISFWSTLGAFGNDITAEELSPINHQFALDIPAIGPVKSMLPTKGGKNGLSQNEKINAYKNAILARDRVVTYADIRAACLSSYGEFLQDIQISKSIVQHMEARKGLERCLKINLTFKDTLPLSEQDRDNLCHDIEKSLQEKNYGLYPIHVRPLPCK
ncbi:type VI secretion system baseplate subunit TssF [candidate division KSB1 bacterium]|nr:type VI secretion system baseplate subunit TssF [candidate division KSB1 bacterium]